MSLVTETHNAVSLVQAGNQTHLEVEVAVLVLYVDNKSNYHTIAYMMVL